MADLIYDFNLKKWVPKEQPKQTVKVVSPVQPRGSQVVTVQPKSAVAPLPTVKPANSFVGPTLPAPKLFVKPLPAQPTIKVGGSSQTQTPTYNPQTPAPQAAQQIQPAAKKLDLSKLQELKVSGVDGTAPPPPPKAKPSLLQVFSDQLNLKSRANQETTKLAGQGLQEIARSGASVGATISEMYGGANQLTPSNSFEKALYGDKPVKSLNTRIAEATPQVQEFAKRRLNLDLSKGQSTALSLPLIVGLTALDFTGWGGGKKTAIEALTKFKNVDDIVKVMQKIGVADDFIKEYAPILAKTSKEAEVSKIIDHINELQKTAPLAKTAKSTYPTAQSRMYKTEGELKIAALEAKSQLKATAATKSSQLPPVKKQPPQLLKPTAVTKGPKIVAKTSYQKSIPEVSTFYNVDRMRIPEAAKVKITTDLEAMSTQLEEIVGKRLSHNEVIAFANKSKATLEKVIGIEETKAVIAQQLNTRRLVATSAKEFIENAGKQSKDEYIDALFRSKSFAEDTARRLEAQKIRVSGQQRTIVEAVVDRLKKQVGLTDELARAAKEVDWADPESIAQLYRKQVGTRAEEWIDLIRYNSMLSSPNTWLVNLSGGIQSSIVRPVQKTIEGGIDLIGSLLGNRPRKQFAGEGAAFVSGMAKEAGHKFQRLINTITKKQLPIPEIVDAEYASKIPLTKAGTKARIAERALDFPGRIMQATDNFVASFIKAGEESSLGYRVKKGVAVNNIREKSLAAAEYSLFRKVRNPAEGFSEGKILDAIQTFSNTFKEWSQSKNPVVRWPTKITLPFIQIATQITKQSVEFSPLGLATLWGATNKTEQLAKSVIGITSALLTGLLVGGDRLTFGEPISETQKNAFRDSGRKPYSIKIGNKWIPYAKLHPALAINFAFVSALKQAREEAKISDHDADVYLGMFAKSAQFMADQSFLRNIGDFISATQGETAGFTKYASNYVVQLFPYRSMLSWLNRSFLDDTQRQADPDKNLFEKQLQYFIAQVPGLSKQLPARLNAQGDPIKSSDRLLNAVSPFGPIGTSKPEAEQSFKQQIELSRIGSQNTKDSAQVKKDAEQIFAKTKTMSPEERQKYIKDNPPTKEVFDKLIEVTTENIKGYNSFEKAFSNASVETRGEWLFKQLEGKPQSEQSTIMQGLADKGLLTDAVMEQLGSIITTTNK